MRRIIGTIAAVLAIAALAATGVASTRDSAAHPGGGKSFVGPADDPFFVDLASAANATSPKDDLKNFGTYALGPEPA